MESNSTDFTIKENIVHLKPPTHCRESQHCASNVAAVSWGGLTSGKSHGLKL